MVSTNDEPQQTASADVQIEQDTEIKMISEEDLVKAQKNFQQGKKNLMLNKYAESVNNIEEACRVYSAKYGEFDPQCADVYFYYGKALLELARVENNVLGNALTGVPEDTGPINDSRYGNPDDIAPEEKEQISDKVIDAMCTEEKETGETAKTTEGETTGTTTTTTETTKPDEEMLEKKPTTTETTTTTEEKKTTEGGELEAKPAKEGEEEGDEEEDDEDDEDEEEGEDETAEGGAKDNAESADDISNLQRAWEMFELAKLVYSKNFNEDLVFKKKRVAECLLKLGEISIEQELYEQACTDIKESIRLQEEQRDEDRDERMLAESYYQQGLAQQFSNLFDDAKESFQRALNILQLRTEKLRGRLEGGTCDDDEKTKLTEEIAEIEALLPELNGKLEEVAEQDKQSVAAIQEAKECFMNNVVANGGFTGAASNGGEVKDITSMVKSKRKISGPQEEVNGLKKTRLSANGAPSGSEENGSGEQMQTTETPAPGAATTTNTTTEETTETTTTTTTKTDEAMPTETTETTNGTTTETIAAQ